MPNPVWTDLTKWDSVLTNPIWSKDFLKLFHNERSHENYINSFSGKNYSSGQIGYFGPHIASLF